MNNPSSLAMPNIRAARLPQTYESAKTALQACERLDECKDWADKAAALASYAKQADDKTLEVTAERIRSRAVRRCGELLREMKPAPGRPPKPKDPEEIRRGSPPNFRPAPSVPSLPPTRSQAARAAGLSRDQQKTAIRVANVPREDFERAVDSPSPPTVTQLAEIGTKKRPAPLVDLGGRDPKDFQSGTTVWGEIKWWSDRIDQMPNLDAATRGMTPIERSETLNRIARIENWFGAVSKALRSSR